ncbi:hypothetical protein C5N14_21145 [Micromonospora sp. MW-13]|uniref:hypothetical protein n=1 Tax=Micromonospora sp. MW-13 TaxID=2094022 RepID=UPI000E44A355|nr:hypothetical protein [Micromonospora sp. MW-13]RGC66964.1 hypothetical protein C5N14_21145 [Micromonospora sp. MW-13]
MTRTAADRVPHPRPRHRGWALVAAVLAVAAFPAAEPRPAAPHKDDTFITAQTTGILNIEGGECFTDPAHSRRAGGVVVLYRPCEEHADNQSYAFLHAADGPWDRPALAAFAWAGCGGDFDRRWTSRAASGLDYYPILPTAETWADGDRDIMCVVYRPGGQLSRSLVPLLR